MSIESVKKATSISMQHRRESIMELVEKIQRLLVNFNPEEYSCIIQLESCVEDIRRNHTSLVAIKVFDEFYEQITSIEAI